MRHIFTLLLSVCTLSAAAQEAYSPLDSLHYKVEMQATLSHGDHTPLWLNANRYGLSSLETTNGYVRAAALRPLLTGTDRHWDVGYGLDVAVAKGFTSTLIIQQAFAEVRWLKGVLTVGSKEYPMELKNQELSTGSQTLGINARPIPQARIALPDYWVLPFAKGWLSIKGHVAYGMQTDDQWQREFTGEKSRYAERSRYHSKAGYLKIGNEYRFYPVSLELGLEMACQFGGTTYRGNGTTVSNEGGLKGMWHAFLPGGGDSTDGDAWQNAGGNHLGSWVARLNFNYDSWYLGLYADQYFEDHSMMLHLDYDGYGSGDEWNVKKEHRYFLYDFKDWLLGAELRLKDATWLNNIVLEYMYTKYQGGPLYHDHTSAISDHISGRDNYYNHSLFTGWQHWGMVMGNPLYMSPLYNDDGTIRVRNNRFVAWHLGLSGDPSEQLHYRVLATWQRGYGTYDALYRDPRKTVSMLAEAAYNFPSWSALKGWSVKAAAAFDTGELYGKNYGFQLTVAKTGLLNLKSKNR